MLLTPSPKAAQNPTKVPSKGPSNAKIMVVGEAPGANEIFEKKPFVGPSGQLLDGILLSVGLDPTQIYFTNICKIRPPGNDIGEYFTDSGLPTDPIIEGLTELKSEIDTLKPNVIIPVGNYPLKFLTGRGTWNKKNHTYTGIGSYRGYMLRGSAIADGYKCLPTYHPSAVLRNYPLKHLVRLDLSRVAAESNHAEIRYPNKFIFVNPRGTDREAWRDWLCSPPGTLSPLFTYNQGHLHDSKTPQIPIRVPSSAFGSSDIEGSGPNLYCIGFTRHPDVAIVFPTDSKADIAFIRGICVSGIPWCFQNGMFDCSLLEWFHDVLVYPFLKHDTMIAMHAAYTEMDKDLGMIGSLYALQRDWWHGIDAHFWAAVAAGSRDREDMYVYNGGDVWNTQNAMESMLDDELHDPDIMSTYTHEMALVEPLWDVAKKGVLIAVQQLNTLKTQLVTEIVTLSAGLQFLNNGIPLNVKSGPQKAKFIYDVLGCPKVDAKTPGGDWKMDDTTLAQIQLKSKDAKQRKAISMVRAVSERRDLISKFCNIELDTDGRMRCHYDPAKTDTGRLSSRKFNPTGNGANLQNIPKDSRVRAVFIPDPGYVFGYADLKSAESLVVAHITGDPEMLRLHSSEYMDGTRDGHKYVASCMLGKPIDQVTKDERYLGKRIRHAGNYGMSWHKLMQLINADAQETGVSIDAAMAKLLINKYRQLHPYLETWWNDILQQLWATHTIYTLHRRKRIFYNRPDAILPDAIAYNPQGTVAQTLNMGLLRCEPKYHLSHSHWQRQWDQAHDLAEALFVEQSGLLQELGFQLLLQVHDAIGFQVPEKNADRALALLPSLMDIPIPIKRKGIAPYLINIPLEIQAGYNWGEYDPKKPDLNPNGLKSWKPNQLIQVTNPPSQSPIILNG